MCQFRRRAIFVWGSFSTINQAIASCQFSLIKAVNEFLLMALYFRCGVIYGIYCGSRFSAWQESKLIRVGFLPGTIGDGTFPWIFDHDVPCQRSTRITKESAPSVSRFIKHIKLVCDWRQQSN